MKLAGVLLAAGASRRFGHDDKLLAELYGKPLVCHAADKLRAVSPDVLIAVTRSDAVAAQLAGFENVRPPMPDPAQGDSLKAGVAAAKAEGADKVLIVLGDMPLVTVNLMQSVVAACTTNRPSAAIEGAKPMPPTCFPAAFYPQLLAIDGDRGAGNLLRDLPSDALVHASERTLMDVDTLQALENLRKL